LLNQWDELIQIASGIELTEEEDAIIWQYSSNGKFSVQTLYAIINDMGVWQGYTPVVWKIRVSSKIHIFLWLLGRNKVFTRDNLAKRRDVDGVSCLFCLEAESSEHLFFKCYVASCVWERIADVLNTVVVRDFESLAKWWIRGINIMLLMFFMLL
jgi:hypothetical protein